MSNIETISNKEFEKLQIAGLVKVGTEQHFNSSSKLNWSVNRYIKTNDQFKRELLLTLWNSGASQTVIADYIITDIETAKEDRFNEEWHLDTFIGDLSDLQDEIEAWIDEHKCSKEQEHNEPAALATEPKSNRWSYKEDDAIVNDDELKIDNLYSETDAMITAKMMNDFGLSFVTTVEDENPDLSRKPPFTADDIVKWFEEAIRIIQKRYDEEVVGESADETEYANGPICITANKYGTVSLNVNLFSRVGE